MGGFLSCRRSSTSAAMAKSWSTGLGSRVKAKSKRTSKRYCDENSDPDNGVGAGDSSARSAEEAVCKPGHLAACFGGRGEDRCRGAEVRYPAGDAHQLQSSEHREP